MSSITPETMYSPSDSPMKSIEVKPVKYSNEKTRMCIHRDFCKRGKSCKFAHSEEEYVCLPCRRGKSCSFYTCSFIHPEESREKYFERVMHKEKVVCKKGNSCSKIGCGYVHPENSMPVLSLPEPCVMPVLSRTTSITPRTNNGKVHLTNIPKNLARQMFIDLVDNGATDIHIEIS